RIDSIAQADIHEFTLKEKSGLYIRELTTKALYSNRTMEFQELYLATNNSVVQDYLKFDYADITDFNDFIRKVHINSHLKDSYVDSRDVEFSARTMEYVVFETSVQQGDSTGTGAGLKAKSVALVTAQKTALVGGFTIRG